MSCKPRRSLRSRLSAMLAILLAVLLASSAAGCAAIDRLLKMPLVASETTSEPGTSGTGPAGNETAAISSPLQINEVCTSNSSILQTANGLTPDWIELYNSGNAALSLDGYGLSDNVKKPLAWTLPAVIIPAHGYLLIYASGDLAENEAQASGSKEIYADFRLAATGEDLILSSPSGQVIDEWKIPVLPVDTSYGRAPVATPAAGPGDTARLFFVKPTPGQPNGPDGVATVEQMQASVIDTLLISEYCTNNESFYDEDGDYPDWVEIWNKGSEPLVLTGFTLTDVATKPDKWTFPALTLQPGQYQLLWLSGKEKTWTPDSQAASPGSPDQAATRSGIHVSFKLGDADQNLMLLDTRGQVINMVKLQKLPANVSYGIVPEKPADWVYYPRPTPGRVNDSTGFADLQAATAMENKPVWINEAYAQDTQIRGGASQSDWIELYNNTGQKLDLAGYSLTDDAARPRLQKLDGITIKAHEYKAIQLTKMGLAATGETVTLFNTAGEPVDIFATGYLRPGGSSGRLQQAGQPTSADRVFFLQPTKGTANTSRSYTAYTAMPQIIARNKAGGADSSSLYPDGPVTVELAAAGSNTRLYYTLNGAPPTTESTRYSQPLTISQTATLRVIAVSEGALASDEATRTFLFEDHHDLPVISLMGKDADFFSSSGGVWTNFRADLEKPVNVSFYETDGRLGVQFNAGVAMHGQYSRTEPQKSLELNLRTGYGDDYVTYPFFKDYDVTTFKHLILRTSSQDWRYTKLRDAFMSMVVQDQMAVDTMSWRPCVLYINGEYFGLYEIRENLDEYYFEAHHGADPANIDLIKGNKIILEGDYNNYGALLDYVRTHSMQNEKSYQYVLSQIDEHSLMDWIIVETFFNNLDSGNKKFWRERKEGAQWRWVMYDFDWAMFPSTYEKNILKYDLLDPAGHGQYNIFSSTLQVKLMANPAFKEAFIERYAHFLNTTFATKRMLNILDDMTGQIRSEMPRQIARWKLPSTVRYWENNVATLRRITSEKRGRMIKILQESFNISSARMKKLFPDDY